MNLKEIKDAARKAFSDQQSQDTEGGVPDAISFIAGFVEGAKHLEAELNEVELREVKANRLVVDLARQLTSLQSAFDDRVRVIEMQLEDKKKLESKNRFLEACLKTMESRVEALIQVNDGLHSAISKLKEENKKLVEALKFYADLNDEVVMYDSRGVAEARQVLKEIGEE